MTAGYAKIKVKAKNGEQEGKHELDKKIPSTDRPQHREMVITATPGYKTVS